MLFKIASHVTRTGRGGRAFYVHELLTKIWPAIAMTLRANPEWLSSKAGVPWAVENYENWTRAMDKQGRAQLGEPPRVAEVEYYPGYYLVELMNSRHVHAEGVALGHCMSWSLNQEALAKHGYPRPDTPEAMECLTYAMKIRYGELRLFSLRGPENKPLMSLSFSVAARHIEEMRGDGSLHQSFGWTISQCALFKSLSSVVDLELSHRPQWGGCLRRCPGNGWCEGVIKFCGERHLPSPFYRSSGE
ncbi:hypothetical protein [Hyphomicrobium sp.]|uniref:hypothetical protein n=1 Tax=Hyphomicrobium sp. TaxID=82 RepID=UPI00356954F6